MQNFNKNKKSKSKWKQKREKMNGITKGSKLNIKTLVIVIVFSLFVCLFFYMYTSNNFTSENNEENITVVNKLKDIDFDELEKNKEIVK